MPEYRRLYEKFDDFIEVSIVDTVAPWDFHEHTLYVFMEDDSGLYALTADKGLFKGFVFLNEPGTPKEWISLIYYSLDTFCETLHDQLKREEFNDFTFLPHQCNNFTKRQELVRQDTPMELLNVRNVLEEKFSRTGTLSPLEFSVLVSTLSEKDFELWKRLFLMSKPDEHYTTLGTLQTISLLYDRNKLRTVFEERYGKDLPEIPKRILEGRL